MNKNVFFNIIYKAVSVMMIVVISVSGLVGCGSKKTSSVTPGSSILPAPTKSITDAPVNAKTNERKAYDRICLSSCLYFRAGH